MDLADTVATGVAYCTIANMGENGIYMEDDISERLTLSAATNSLTYNTIYNMGRLCWTYNPGINVVGVGNYIAHNLIYNGRSQAINIFGNNHILELQMTSTMSARRLRMLVPYIWTAIGRSGAMLFDTTTFTTSMSERDCNRRV